MRDDNLSEKIVREGELWGEDFAFPKDMFWAEDVKTFIKIVEADCQEVEDKFHHLHMGDIKEILNKRAGGKLK